MWSPSIPASPKVWKAKSGKFLSCKWLRVLKEALYTHSLFLHICLGIYFQILPTSPIQNQLSHLPCKGAAKIKESRKESSNYKGEKKLKQEGAKAKWSKIKKLGTGERKQTAPKTGLSNF